MADTFIWGISNLERHLDDGAVYAAYWTVTATRTVNGSDMHANSYGSFAFGQPDPNNFIPYEDLTPNVVIEWVKNGLGTERVAEIELGLSQRLDVEETPINGSGVPW